MRNYFPKLLGNEATKDRLGPAIERNTLPHAFLIGGPSGSGKSTLATEIAAAINCEKREIEEYSLPCGGCASCKRIYDGNFPDVKILTKKKDKATLGVDPVKDFREDMFLSSTESYYKVYIIDDAESMTVEAQNALLKVLEEPPSGVVIILLAKECDRILTTIKSRAQYVAMSRFGEEDLTRHLLSKNPESANMKNLEPEKFEGVIMSADGRIGRAVELSSKKSAEENEKERSVILGFIRAIGQKSDYAQILEAVNMLPTKRYELILALEKIISALRDLIAIKNDDGARLIFFPSASFAKNTAGDISILRLMSVYDSVLSAHELCVKNANIGNLLINLASKIKTN